jgi:tRNA A-37 threonylcarbamoyl transferase component Bud32
VHFVNWQRKISVEEQNGQKVMVKRSKPTKLFHEFLIIYAYSLISLLFFHPSPPPTFSEITRNEGYGMRNNLKKIGIRTPKLFSMSDTNLIEEYIEGGNLYWALASGSDTLLAYEAGCITGKLHEAGYAFIDNKAENYLVTGDSVIRTDLSFMKKTHSHYSKSMDIGSFLASVIDLGRYGEIVQSFHDGYLSESDSKFSYLSILIRNVLSVGFSSNSKTTLRNIFLDSRTFIGV